MNITIVCDQKYCRFNAIFFRDCKHPFPRIYTYPNEKICKSFEAIKGCPFDEPIYNPICKDCGHQNSENCNTCSIIHGQFDGS